MLRGQVNWLTEVASNTEWAEWNYISEMEKDHYTNQEFNIPNNTTRENTGMKI